MAKQNGYAFGKLLFVVVFLYFSKLLLDGACGELARVSSRLRYKQFNDSSPGFWFHQLGLSLDYAEDQSGNAVPKQYIVNQAIFLRNIVSHFELQKIM